MVEVDCAGEKNKPTSAAFAVDALAGVEAMSKDISFCLVWVLSWACWGNKPATTASAVAASARAGAMSI